MPTTTDSAKHSRAGSSSTEGANKSFTEKAKTKFDDLKSLAAELEEDPKGFAKRSFRAAGDNARELSQAAEHTIDRASDFLMNGNSLRRLEKRADNYAEDLKKRGALYAQPETTEVKNQSNPALNSSTVIDLVTTLPFFKKELGEETTSHGVSTAKHYLELKVDQDELGDLAELNSALGRLNKTDLTGVGQVRTQVAADPESAQMLRIDIPERLTASQAKSVLNFISAQIETKDNSEGQSQVAALEKVVAVLSGSETEVEDFLASDPAKHDFSTTIKARTTEVGKKRTTNAISAVFGNVLKNGFNGQVYIENAIVENVNHTGSDLVDITYKNVLSRNNHFSQLDLKNGKFTLLNVVSQGDNYYGKVRKVSWGNVQFIALNKDFNKVDNPKLEILGNNIDPRTVSFNGRFKYQGQQKLYYPKGILNVVGGTFSKATDLITANLGAVTAFHTLDFGQYDPKAPENNMLMKYFADLAKNPDSNNRTLKNKVKNMFYDVNQFPPEVASILQRESVNVSVIGYNKSVTQLAYLGETYANAKPSGIDTLQVEFSETIRGRLEAVNDGSSDMVMRLWKVDSRLDENGEPMYQKFAGYRASAYTIGVMLEKVRTAVLSDAYDRAEFGGVDKTQSRERKKGIFITNLIEKEMSYLAEQESTSKPVKLG